MRIELLYFDGCPNHRQALENVKRALAQTGLDATIDITRIENNEEAVAKRFLGSPSIRINGKDLENLDEANTEYSMRCRRYKEDTEIRGFPSVRLIAEAMQENLTRE